MKKVFFLGQAPARPSSKHEVVGTYLHPWLTTRIGLCENDIKDYCYFYALVDIFPGSHDRGHMAPLPEQILAHRSVLKRALSHIQPNIIVPVGKMALVEVLGDKNIKLSDYVGTSLKLDPFDALGHTIISIPISHPSGRSTWNALNAEKITPALTLLRKAVE